MVEYAATVAKPNLNVQASNVERPVWLTVQFARGMAAKYWPEPKAGKRSIAAANLKHGLYTRQAITERQTIAARLAQLEDVMYLAKMTDAPRTRGRKPTRYEPVQSLDDVPRMLGIGRNRADDDEQEIYP